MAIEVQVVSNSQAARQDLEKLSQSVGKIEKAVETTSDRFKDLTRNIAATVISGATLVSFAKLSDTLTSLESKLKVSVEGFGDFNDAMKETRNIAMSTGNRLADVSTLYSKLAMSAGQLGVSQKDVAKVTNAVTKSLALSGATAVESSAAILQLGQAMASGKLSGDELRSIMENAPQLAKAIASGLGVAMGDLRKLGEAGQLTSDLVFGSILANVDTIDESFKKVGMTFGKAFTNLANVGVVFVSAVRNFGQLTNIEDGLEVQSKTLADSINDVALSLYKFADSFEIRVLQMRLNFWLFVNDITKALSTIPAAFTKVLGSDGLKFFDKISGIFNNLSKIKIMNYMPDMAKSLEYIKSWTVTAERAFFWLYDQVIGHSWIPDLVEGVLKWMKILNQEPVKLITEFVKTASNLFSNLTEKALGIPFIDNLISKFQELKDSLKGTNLARNLRQVLGMRETVEGAYKDRTSPTGMRQYDTSAFVGRGPSRNDEKRGAFHDFVNSFSSENQIPVIAGIISSISTGLMVGVTSGNFIAGLGTSLLTAFVSVIGGLGSRLVPIGIMIGTSLIAVLSGNKALGAISAVLSVAFGLALSNAVSREEISLTASNIVKAFVDGAQSIVTLLFGSGIFGEKGFGGTLLVIAKLALLFKEGREGLLKAAIGVATAPTRIADAFGDVFQKKFIDAKTVRAETKAASLMQEHSDTLNKYSKDVRKELKTLQGMTGPDGGLIPKSTVRDLMKVIRKDDPMGFTAITSTLGHNARQAAEQLKSSVKSYDTAKAQSANINSAAAKFKESAINLKATSVALGERIAETREATQRGFMSMAGGVGGVFGTLAGFNIGGKIAEQMVGYSDWSKVGVQMAVALVGQGVGAALGQGIARTIIMSMGLITSPITLAIAAGATLIYAAYKTFEDPKWITKAYDTLSTLGEIWGKAIVRGILDLVTGRDPAKQASLDAQRKPAQDLMDAWTKAVEAGNKDLASTLFKDLKVESKLLEAKGDTFFSKFIKNTEDAANRVNIFKDALDKLKGLPEKILDLFVGSAQAAEIDAVNHPYADATKFNIPETQASKRSPVSPEMEARLDKALSKLDIINGVREATLLETAATKLNIASGKLAEFNSGLKEQLLDARDKATEFTDANFEKLVAAIRSRETGGMKNPAAAVSVDKAYGAMQITEDTFKRFARAGENFTNETDRIAVATRFLRKLWEQTGGDVKKSAAMYIGGDSPTKGGVLPSGELRDFGPDSLGTTPKAYAEQVYARFNNSKVEAQATSTVNTVKSGILGAKDFLEELYNTYKNEGLSAAAQKLSKAFAGTAEVSKTSFEDSIASAMTMEDLLERYNGALEKMGIAALTMAQLEVADPSDLDKITDLIVAWQKSQIAFAENVTAQNEAMANRFQKLSNQSKTGVKNVIKGIKLDPEAADGTSDVRNSKEWAEQAWKNLNTALADGMYKAIKGETTFKEFANNFGQAVVNTVLEGLTKGLSQALLAPLEKIGPEILKQVFSWGSKAGDVATFPVTSAVGGLADMFKPAAKAVGSISSIPGLNWNTAAAEGSSSVAAVAEQSTIAFKDTVQENLSDMPSWFDDIWGTISSSAGSFVKGIGSLMSSIGSGVSGGWSWVTGLLGAFGSSGVAAATGGYISGPGTGTSDSIPAMLSNGEYVVNAESTKKYGNILGAINAGTFGAFAEGGAVGSATSSVSTDAGVSGIVASASQSATLGEDTAAMLSQKMDMLSMQVNGVLQAISGVNSNITDSANTIMMMQVMTNMQLGLMQLMSTMNQMALATELGMIAFELALIQVQLGTKFASGGHVSGPGTGTSDSIPAMLSNGEYVINARSTSKFKPLLDQINSGGELHFADGGSVGNIGALNPTLIKANASTKAKEQVFNINVTGDVSRQTRKEIVEMMPQIAGGVNSFNYEKNRRR